MPMFVIPGHGTYRVQPVAVEDVAEIATWAAEQTDNMTLDAAGPDTMTYAELVEASHRRGPPAAFFRDAAAADAVGG